MSVILSAPAECDVGFLTLNEHGAILASGGELENDEAKAQILYRLVTMHQKTDKFLEDGCTRISVNFREHSYVICLSNNKFYIVKKKNTIVENEDEGYVPETEVSISNSINA